MSGSTLQSGRYVLQELLSQTDFEVTYRATHRYLEQGVAVQTFNPALQQHPNFPRLRQAFIDEVRRRSEGSQNSLIKVMDGFEEEGMPFVVLRLIPGQMPPYLRDWLPLTRLVQIQDAAHSSEVSLGNGVSDAGNVAIATPHASPPETQPNAALQDVGRSHGGVANGKADVSHPSTIPLASYPQTHHEHRVTGNGTGQSASQNGGRSPHPQTPAKKKRNALMPLALVLTAMVGGLAGASFGWVLRFGIPDLANSSPSTSTAEEDNASLFNFGKEQSFPPVEDWPIQEFEDYTPATRSSREPDYRPSQQIPVYEDPAIEPDPFVPEPDPIPSELTPAPVAEDPAWSTTPVPLPDSSEPKPLPSPVSPIQPSPSPVPELTQPPLPTSPDNSSGSTQSEIPPSVNPLLMPN